MTSNRMVVKKEIGIAKVKNNLGRKTKRFANLTKEI